MKSTVDSLNFQEAQPAIVLTPRRNISRGRWETDRSVSAEVLLSVLLVGLFFGREVYDIKLAIAVPVIPSILMQTKVHTFLEGGDLVFVHSASQVPICLLCIIYTPNSDNTETLDFRKILGWHE